MSLKLSKEIAFLDLAAQHLDYSESEITAYSKLIKRGAELSSYFWEMIVEKLSGFKFVDEAGYDFEDFSEAKTGSVTLRWDEKKGYHTRNGRITNVGNKIGYMRVAIWNECNKKIEYFLIPPDHDCVSYSCKTNPQNAIHFGYASTKDTYSNNLDKYRCSNIQDVCRVLTESFYVAA